MDTGIQKPIFITPMKNGSTDNLAVDGSVTNIIYKIAPSSNQIFRLSYWQMSIKDGKGFDINNFGSNGILTNGIMPRIKADGGTYDMLPAGIRTNSDLAMIAEDFNLYTFGTADDILVTRWNFNNFGQMVRLDGSQGDELQLVVRDNLTNISAIKVLVAGYIEKGY